MDQYEGSLGEGRAIIAWKPIAWFLGIAFSGAWILFLLPLAIGPAGSPAYRVAVLVTFPVAMWMPGIAAILATVVIGGQRFGSLNLRRLGPKRFYLWAWLLPPVLALATGLLTVVLGAGQLDLSFGLIREALMTAPGFEDISLLLIVALQIGLAISIAPFINTIFALGEELGWRGFLLNRLLPLGRYSGQRRHLGIVACAGDPPGPQLPEPAGSRRWDDGGFHGAAELHSELALPANS